jgi:hypothetical protein
LPCSLSPPKTAGCVFARPQRIWKSTRAFRAKIYRRKQPAHKARDLVSGARLDGSINLAVAQPAASAGFTRTVTQCCCLGL